MATANAYRRKARRVARSEGINPTLFERQINQESGFDPNAGSPAGAQGIAQFMPATARARGVDPSNPSSSLKGAAKLMREYLGQYGGDWTKALTAYNAGPGRVGKPLFAETRNYVNTIVGGGGAKQSTPTATSPAAPSFAPWSVKTGQKTTFDQAGFQQAQKKQIVAQMLSKRHRGGSLFRTGLLSTKAPSAADFTTSQLTSKLVKGPAEGGEGGAVTGSAQSMLSVASQVGKLKLPYKWGGGHGAKPAPVGTPVDCSGYVSQILGVAPRTSGGFMSFGKPGAGKQVTLYANQGHILIEIGGRFFGTSKSNPGGGAGEIPRPSAAYLSRFVKRHPPGQ